MLATLIVLAMAVADTSAVLVDHIDFYDPVSGAYLGAESTHFAPDGRRQRWEIRDADGNPSLLFFVVHDAQGHEVEAHYTEGGDAGFDRETFTWNADRTTRTTTYYYEPGVASDRTEIDVDEEGRDLRKRYFRGDGTQYGEEDVLWNTDGTRRGWDFRRVGREGGASFRYTYLAADDHGRWTRRTRSRDGVVERLEVRTLWMITAAVTPATPAPFAPGVISTDASETSPSFSRDGRTMVFARYGEVWSRKEPFIAELGEDGWEVAPLAVLGPVYNLAIAPDARSIVYAVEAGGPLLRITRTDSGWSDPEDLTALFGLAGAYPALTDAGDLVFSAHEGSAGDGIYVARRDGAGFATPGPLYVPPEGTTFDGYTTDLAAPLLVTRCLDDVCAPGPLNGVWEVAPGGEARKVPGLGYVWGVQPVPELGILVVTDGADILAVPLTVLGR